MDQINLTGAIVGILGLGLIVNAIAIIISSKYYSFFSRTYFIEPASDIEKDKVKKEISKDQDAQRYGLSIISIGLGLVATLWSTGILKSIPFFGLAAIAFILGFIFKLIKHFR